MRWILGLVWKIPKEPKAFSLILHVLHNSLEENLIAMKVRLVKEQVKHKSVMRTPEECNSYIRIIKFMTLLQIKPALKLLSGHRVRADA